MTHKKKDEQRIEGQKEALLKALEKSLGVVSAACRKVGVSRQTFYNWVEADPEFKQSVDEITELSIDFAETSLFTQIQNGNTAATIFYLKTKGRKRGYLDIQELHHDIKPKVTGFNFIIPGTDDANTSDDSANSEAV